MKRKAFMSIIVVWGMIGLIPQYKQQIKNTSLHIASSIVNGRQHSQQVALADEFGSSTTSNIAMAAPTKFSISTGFQATNLGASESDQLATLKSTDQLLLASISHQPSTGLPVRKQI